VNGWLLMNRVRLGYELWRTFNGFPLDWPGETSSKGGDGEAKKGGAK
jgi:hypothetical protein